MPRGSRKRSFRRHSKADARREKHLVPKDIIILPQNLSQLQTTSLSENNNKENNNIDSSFIVVAGKMSASGSAATSATATAATAATATNSSPKSPRKTKRWFSFVLENIERDARFRTMCTETLNKRLQKAYEKLTKRETQAHNKEWILLKMARFVLETNNAAGEEEREEEEEEYKEEEEEREAVKNSMFARLRQILEETVESEREEEGHTRNVPAPSSSNNSNYNNNFRKNRKRKVTTKEREEKTAAVAAVSSTTMIPLQCSRNDGKSWRCSALAVEGHKHCAKHLRWGYGARAANNAQHIASIANIIAAAEKNNKNNNNKNNNSSSKLIHRNKDTRALEKKSRHLPKRRVNLSDAGEKQQRLREEKMYEQHRVEYERRMQKKIKSSVVQTTSSDGTNIACTIEVCEKNEEKEDDCLSENTSIPLFSRPGGSLKNSSSSSLSSLSSSSIGVMKTINLDDFSGYGPLREHLLKLAAGASSNSTGREISVMYWTAHNTAHQIALGEPYEYFKAKCVKLHAKVYPKASSSGTGGGFRSIKIPLVAGPTSSSSSSSSPSATMYMMLMMQNDKNKNIFFPASST